ncbi:LysR family transcriptional regulator [Candidatus Contubernalis alkaliaceticus]|uniref:LysR family transcriptional regulator n=1 Tax=Candidatus Contubernalis alkaliaceticus TaxID=338645 RepID=UPI001F4BDF2B|nr:LysR family transcriptional regulator [Candidatus Contubernalis alkalaceticus]UNC92776.1 LysR family transcriptional regulator [Candidatus Contubernalis alkalaceticus]
MNLSQVTAFCTVVKAGSISKAAKHLHLTQPALSLQIQDLEEHFQTQLLERSNRGVKVTLSGELLYSYGQRMMSLNENLIQEINALTSLGNEQMMIGASSTIGGYALPCSIYIFKEKYPQSDVKMTIANTKEILEQTEDGVLDIGLIEGPLNKKLLNQQKLIAKNICKDELVMITPANEKWIDREVITLDELTRLPLILREKGSGIRETVEKALNDNDLQMNDCQLTMELSTLESIKSCVEAGQGISIISRLAVRRELRHGTLKALQVEGISFPHYFTVIYSCVKPKTGLQKTFIEFIKCPHSRSFC